MRSRRSRYSYRGRWSRRSGRRGCRARTVITHADEELRRLVTEGRESGEPVDGEAVLDRLRTKYVAMASEDAR